MPDRSPITSLAGSERLLYSREETAEILSLSVHTITRDVKRGRIEARRYGRRVLIPRSEILRIADQGMKRATPTAA